MIASGCSFHSQKILPQIRPLTRYLTIPGLTKPPSRWRTRVWQNGWIVWERYTALFTGELLPRISMEMKRPVRCGVS